MATRLGGQIVLLLLVVGTIGCDRVTKHLASTTLAGLPGRSFLSGTVRLEYAENAGGFLSLGSGLPPVVRTGVFTFGTGLALVVLVGAAVRLRWNDARLVGLGLFAAGGASNLADRLLQGTVVDFMNVGLGPVRTGIFNVADVAIMVGAAILVVAEWRHRRRGDFAPTEGGAT